MQTLPFESYRRALEAFHEDLPELTRKYDPRNLGQKWQDHHSTLRQLVTYPIDSESNAQLENTRTRARHISAELIASTANNLLNYLASLATDLQYEGYISQTACFLVRFSHCIPLKQFDALAVRLTWSTYELYLNLRKSFFFFLTIKPLYPLRDLKPEDPHDVDRSDREHYDCLILMGYLRKVKLIDSERLARTIRETMSLFRDMTDFDALWEVCVLLKACGPGSIRGDGTDIVTKTCRRILQQWFAGRRCLRDDQIKLILRATRLARECKGPSYIQHGRSTNGEAESLRVEEA